jgi:sulfatase maturation enzyme AslB (radical SAM superfamily)
MANLMLTHRCTLQCDYCFAVVLSRDTSITDSDVSLDTFQSYIDFLDHAGLVEARLLGGEPTLHPEFALFVAFARSRGKKLVVFSNGLIPESALQALLKVPSSECAVLVNLASGDALPGVRRQQENVLTRLGQRACPGYTISRVNHPDLIRLLDVIDRTGCRRSLRLALAQPSSGESVFVHPKQYSQISPHICALAVEAGRRQVQVEFDCGFVRCMFSVEELSLLRANHVSVNWHCSPVWDIAPDASGFPCFALAGELRIPDSLDRNLKELQINFDSAFSVLRVAGVFPECSTCELRVIEGCSGGCLAATLRRFRHEPVTYTLNAQDAAAFMKM